MYPNHGHFGLFDIFDHSLIYNSMCLFILIITHTHYICMFPKIVGFPQKWMVKIMENPMYKWMIWGEFTHYCWSATHIGPCFPPYAGGQSRTLWTEPPRWVINVQIYQSCTWCQGEKTSKNLSGANHCRMLLFMWKIKGDSRPTYSTQCSLWWGDLEL